MFITDLQTVPGLWYDQSFGAEIAPGSRRSPASIHAFEDELSYEDIAASAATEADEESELLPAPAHLQPNRPVQMWEKPEFSFGDFLDIINPLQHIPIVATIYRNMSGDNIGMMPRVIGGALWGKLGGLVVGVVNAVVEWFTGKDIGEHIYAAVYRNIQESTVTPEVAEVRESVSERTLTHSAPTQKNQESRASAGTLPQTRLLPYQRNQDNEKSQERPRFRVSA
jgi:hypothetical protein